MNLTVDNSCTFLTVTTPNTNNLEEWENGNLSDVQVTISYNCTEVSQFILPNNYNFGSLQGSCNSVLGGAEFEISLTGILDSQINTTTITSTSANIVSVTPIDKVTFTVLMNSVTTNFIEFTILDNNGHTYVVRVDFGIQVITECDFTDTLTVVSTEDLPCGILFDNVAFELIIQNEYLRADCNPICTTDCRAFCDGIYTIQVVDTVNCIFVNCTTDCEAVDCYIENGGNIMVILDTLKVGSDLTSTGNTDCVSCSQMCDIYNELLKLLGRSTKNNILDDCGCNNN